MKFALLSLLMLSASTFAAIPGYDIKMDLSLNGKKASSGKVQVKEGESAVILSPAASGETFIEVSNVQDTGAGMKMNFVVGSIEEDGSRKVLSRPEVLVEEGQTATVESSDVSLQVSAKRKSL
jgi:hypothetical protein